MALIHWFNRWDEPLGELDLIDASYSESLDGEDMLEITCTDYEVAKGDRLVWKAQDGVWHENVVDTIRNRRRDGMPVTELKCISSMAYDLSHEMMQDSFATSVLEGFTVEAAVRNILHQDYYVSSDDRRWELGTLDETVLHVERMGNQADVNKLSVLNEIAEEGFELYPTITVDNGGVTRRRVNIIPQRGDQDAQWRFQWGSNADAITRNILGHDPVSRLFVYGKTLDGSVPKRRMSIADFSGNPYRDASGNPAPYMESTAALNQWGLPNSSGGKVPTQDIVIFEEAENPGELYNMGVRAWYEMRTLRVGYEIDSARITSDDPEAELSIGDSVQVVDSGFTSELRTTGRITRLVRNLMTGETVVTVGADSKPMSNRFAAMQSREDSLDRRLAALEGGA